MTMMMMLITMMIMIVMMTLLMTMMTIIGPYETATATARRTSTKQ